MDSRHCGKVLLELWVGITTETNGQSDFRQFFKFDVVTLRVLLEIIRFPRLIFLVPYFIS
jgi:L-rhamnose isomerase